MAEMPECYVFEQPLTIEPGKCYVLRANKPLDPLTIRNTIEFLERKTGAKFVILDFGMRMEVLTVTLEAQHGLSDPGHHQSAARARGGTLMPKSIPNAQAIEEALQDPVEADYYRLAQLEKPLTVEPSHEAKETPLP